MSKILWREILKTVVVSVSIVLVLYLANPENPVYINVHPHPFLITAILVSLLSSYRRVLLVSSTLSFLYLYFLAQQVDLLKQESLFRSEDFVLPALIMVLPFLIAVTIARLKAAIASEADRVKNRENAIAQLEQLNEHVVKDKNIIQQKANSREKSVVQIFEKAAVIEEEHIGQIAVAVVQLVTQILWENNCYFYISNGGKFQLAEFVETDGSDAQLPEELSEKFMIEYPLIKESIKRKKISLRENLKIIDKKVALSVPILGSRGVLGILVLRNLQFINNTPGNIAILQAMSNWVGRSLERAMRSRSVFNDINRDEKSGLFTYEFFQQMLRINLERSRKQMAPLHVFRVAVVTESKIDAKLQGIIDHIGAKCLKHANLEYNITAKGKEQSQCFALLPQYTQKEVDAFVERFEKEFRRIQQTFFTSQVLKAEIEVYPIHESGEKVEQFLHEAL